MHLYCHELSEVWAETKGMHQFISTLIFFVDFARPWLLILRAADVATEEHAATTDPSSYW